MTAAVLLNSTAGANLSSGDLEQTQRITAAFAAAGLSVEALAVPPADLTAQARAAAGRHPLVISAGGDGTLRSVAEGLRDTGAALGVLPLGTFNHFAKELEMPLDLEPAARAIARGTPTPVRVGEVNGQLFLSFVAIGFHARAVRHRDAQRRARQRSKMLAMGLALLQVIRRPPLRRYRLLAGTDILRRHSPSLIVASNQYQLDVLGLKQDDPSDRSQLSVCIAHAQSRWGVLRMIFNAWLGRLREDFEVLRYRELTVATRHRHEQAVIDGELTSLHIPLRFRVLPKPLQVIRPPAELAAKPTQQIAART